MAEVFDLTEHCQVAIRYNTGAYPDAHSLTVHIHDNEDASKARKAIEEGHAPHPGIDVIDIAEWDRAVRMAIWILDHVPTCGVIDRHRESLEALAEDDGVEKQTVYAVKELELPDCNFSHTLKIFSDREGAERYLDTLRNPRIGHEEHPERFDIVEYEVE
jgi:hypothetical protein